MTKIQFFAVSIAVLAMSVSCEKSGMPKEFNNQAKISANLAVDMGTGVLWRSGNLGASLADEPGDYYAWGDSELYYEDGQANVTPATFKEDKQNGYAWRSYAFYNIKSKMLTKYFEEGDRLALEDDVAYGTIGGHWRMPTDEEFQQLIDQCEWSVTTLRGQWGVLVTSNVDKSNYIFLPGAGYRRGTELEDVDETAWYWSSDIAPNTENATHLIFTKSGSINSGCDERCLGLSVRPVMDLKYK